MMDATSLDEALATISNLPSDSMVDRKQFEGLQKAHLVLSQELAKAQNETKELRTTLHNKEIQSEEVVRSWRSELNAKSSEFEAVSRRLASDDDSRALHAQIYAELEQPHQQQLQELAQQLESARTATHALKRELERVKLENSYTQQSQQNEIEELRAKLQADEQSALAGIEALKQRVIEASTETPTLKLALHRSQLEKRELEAVLEAQQADLEDALGRLAAAQQHAELCQRESVRIQSETGERVHRFEENLQAANLRAEQLREEINSGLQEQERLMKLLQDTEGQVEVLASQIHELQHELKMEQQQHQIQEQQHLMAKEQLESKLLAEVERLKSQLKSAEEDTQRAQTAVTDMERETTKRFISLRDENASVLARLRADLLGHKMRADEAERRSLAAEARYSSDQTTLLYQQDRASNEIEQLKQTVRQLNDQLEQMQQQKEILQKELLLRSNEVQDVEHRRNRALADCEKANAEKQQIAAQLDAAMNRLNQSKSDVSQALETQAAGLELKSDTGSNEVLRRAELLEIRLQESDDKYVQMKNKYKRALRRVLEEKDSLSLSCAQLQVEKDSLAKDADVKVRALQTHVETFRKLLLANAQQIPLLEDDEFAEAGNLKQTFNCMRDRPRQPVM